MKSKKIVTLFLSAAIILFTGHCKNEGEAVTQDPATDPIEACYSCHGENTELGNKLQWARAGWENSVHANGVRVPIYSSYWSGAASIWFIAGYEWEGSDSFYANGQGCQVCHTKEGFLKRINGDYGTVDWTSGSAFRTAIGADSIANPTPLNCFVCHAPHTKQTFELTVVDTTTVTTEAGSVYGGTGPTAKTKGSMCASCHMVRLGGYADASAAVLGAVQGGSLLSYASYWGPHHGPQTDMLMGNGGAEFVNTYTVSNHTAEPEAHCVNCHMANDVLDLDVPLRYALSPAVGGHSMAVAGIVHGSPKANPAGCSFTGCHEGSASVSASNFGSPGAIAADGYLSKGKAYLNKTGNGITSATHYAEINGLLKLLADPAASCGGLLNSALLAITDPITGSNVDPLAVTPVSIAWKTMPDGSYVDTLAVAASPCVHAGFSANIQAVATATDTTETTIFAKALWNFKFVLEDKSFGIHNPVYVKQLLYDSCVELEAIAVTGTDCTAINGGATGTFTRP